MEGFVRIREAALHRRGQAAARSAHEGTSGLQIQAAKEDEDPGQETREIPHGRRRVTAGVRAARRAAVRPAAAGHVPDVGRQRIHAQRVHDARSQRLPATDLRLPAIRRVADAAGRLRRRILRRVRHRSGLTVRTSTSLPGRVRDRSRLARCLRRTRVLCLAQSQRIISQIRARVAGTARHEARVPGAHRKARV